MGVFPNLQADMNDNIYVDVIAGIYSVNVDYNQQKVTVWGICNKNQVLSTVRTKRKAARFWNNNTNVDSQEEEEDLDQAHIASSSPLFNFKPSFALNKLRSLSFRLVCKKVFTNARSYSFRSI